MSLRTPKSKVATVALLSALTAIPVGAGVAAVSLPAYAQAAGDQGDTPPPPPPPPGKPDRMPGHAMMRDHGPMRDAMRDHGDRWGDHQGRRHHGRRHHENMQMRLAEKLAGVETAIGIRSDQLDAWRDFTSKLVAFVSPQHPGPRGPMADRGPGDQPPGDAAPDAAAPKDTAPGAPSPEARAKPGLGMLDHMVDRAIARGEQAKQLKAALDKLEGVLTPEQMQQARMLMRPDHRHHGHWGHHNWRDHQWGARREGPRDPGGPKPEAAQPPQPAGDAN